MHKFHIVLADGSERTTVADGATVTDGALVLTNDQGYTNVAYAPGTWVSVEKEIYDDRGYPENDPAEPK